MSELTQFFSCCGKHLFASLFLMPMLRSKPKNNIFISYRRADAAAQAGRLFDWLSRQFGVEHIFIDTDKIQAGAQFPQLIADNLDKCDVLLAVIGPQWLNVADDKGRRLDDPHDFVRREIETALANGKRVIPLLVQGAQMPEAEALPAELKQLAWCNALTLGDATFERDFDVLVDDLLGRPRGYIRRELDRLQRILLVTKRASLLIPMLAITLAFFAWVKVFDLFNLDSLTTSYLLGIADRLAGPPPEANVLLLGIDAYSEKKLGHRFNADNRATWRQFHARVIDRAAKAGAAAVVFDMYLTQPSTADNMLKASITRAMTPPLATRTVFGTRSYQAGQPNLLSALLDAGADWGSLCFIPYLQHLYVAPLAVVRRDSASNLSSNNPLVPAHIPALSLTAIRSEQLAAIDISRRQIGFHGNPLPEPVRFSAIARQYHDEITCKTLAAGDDYAMLIIRNRAPGYWLDASRHISYADLLEPGTIKDQRLRGKIILVGLTGLSEDSPVSDQHVLYRGFTRSLIYGVEFHASAMTDLQTGQVVSKPTVDWQMVTLIVMAMLGAATSVLAATKTKLQRRVWLMVFVIAYLVIAVLMALQGIILNVLYELMAFMVAYSLMLWVQRRSLRVNKGSWNDGPSSGA